MDLHELMTGEKPQSFDEKMREGKDRHAGLAGSMRMREDYEKPWHQATHRPTRSQSDET